jgi:kynureninase
VSAATLEEARARDAADPLRDLRKSFALPGDARGNPCTYLCGHSLGLAPLAARALVDAELEDWARLAVLGHEQARRPWIPYHENLTAGLAALAGAEPGEVIAMNSLTVNLHLMLASFYRPQSRRSRILIEAGAFSSDRHAVTSQIAWHGLDPERTLIELAPPPGTDTLSAAYIEAYLAEHGADIALVLWPGVQFRTGQAFDLPRIARAARAQGCLVGFDLAHAIGNVPLALHASDADFAVWCSYKYLNAGPGAIGGCFVHRRHSDAQPRTRHGGGVPGVRLAGWWSHEQATRFEMAPALNAAAGAAAWQISNPPILSAAPLIASLELFTRAGMERLRAKSVALTDFFQAQIEPLAADVEVITPRASAQRGSQLSLRIHGAATRGRRVFDELNARGMICDWRSPDIIRAAPVPLYNRFEDAWQFAHTLQQVLRAQP